MMDQVALPSGAILQITPSPFAIAKSLYQAVLREFKDIPVSKEIEMGNLIKTVFCVGFASLEVEHWVWKCFERCTYNDSKITTDTFESVEGREDYTTLCFEVAKVNVAPFVKSLYAGWSDVLKTIDDIRK